MIEEPDVDAENTSNAALMSGDKIAVLVQSQVHAAMYHRWR